MGRSRATHRGLGNNLAAHPIGANADPMIEGTTGSSDFLDGPSAAADAAAIRRRYPMRLTTLVMACILATAPAMAQDKATIEKLNDAFVGAFKKGDFAAVAALYAEDATVLPNGSTLVKGRSGIQAFWTQAGQGISDIKLTTVDVKPLGPEAAREIGLFILTTKGQQSQQISGK
jgi:uncharacterized protein (TIGR02246 family)